MEVVALQEKHAEYCASMFADAYRRERRAVPTLADREDMVAAFAPRLCRLAEAHPAAAALEGGQIRGYLAGFPIEAFKGPGRGVYCPEWAHGAVGPERARVYHALYCRLARQWVADRCFAHAVTLFAHDSEVRDAWYWNGFGLAVVDAMRGVDAVGAAPPSGVTIRRAGPGDVDRLLPLQQGLARHIADSPVFGRGFALPTRGGVEERLSRSDEVIWLALLGEEAIGYIRAQLPGDDVAAVAKDAPANRAVSGAYTAPAHRKRGVASALLGHVLEWARGLGCSTCTVDFESQNREGAGFWLRHFTPICFSALRRVDERPLAWHS